MVSRTVVLALETSCDETAVAILSARGQFSSGKDGTPNHTNPQNSFGQGRRGRVRDVYTRCTQVSDDEPNEAPTHFQDWYHVHDLTVHAHEVHSQIPLHVPFGGVVPEVAARDHLAHLPHLVQRALQNAGMRGTDLGAVAVTLGPGLIGALMVGVLFGRGFAKGLGIPLWGVNHVDAHLSAALLLPLWSKKDLGVAQEHVPAFEYPALGLTVSGGHCLLSHLDSPTARRVLGTTADDACGEAFDKVGKLMGLSYPAGAAVEAWAAQAPPGAAAPFGTLQDAQNRTGFSFSGLKTAFLLRWRAAEKQALAAGETEVPAAVRCGLAQAFQNAAIEQLLSRVKNALHDWRLYSKSPYKTLFVAGGVAANAVFRERVKALDVVVSLAPPVLCSDNATMIGLHSLLSHHDAFVEHPFARYPFASTPPSSPEGL